MKAKMHTKPVQVTSRPMSTHNLEQSYDYCWQLAKDHYENFPVASWVFPRRLRRHVAAIYAFARTADDFADIHRDEDKLHQWREYLHQYPHAEGIPHPVFPALFDTMTRFQLPLTLLDDLITAFLMDVQGFHPHTWEGLLYYSRYSANPIGRLMLHLMGKAKPHLVEYSDAICTALQLTNFWQDLSVDIPNGRCYLPATWLDQTGLECRLSCLESSWDTFEPIFYTLLKQTRQLYEKGHHLLPLLPGRFRLVITLTTLGGITILNKIQRSNQNILHHRPRLSRWDWVRILFRTIPFYWPIGKQL